MALISRRDCSARIVTAVILGGDLFTRNLTPIFGAKGICSTIITLVSRESDFFQMRLGSVYRGRAVLCMIRILLCRRNELYAV